MKQKERKKIILIDFDGTLNSYASGWQGPTNIPDPPVPGAIDFLIRLLGDDRFEPCIYSSRSRQEGGIEAMVEWLKQQGFPLVRKGVDIWVPATASRSNEYSIRFPTQKPAAFLAIDDRCIQFQGTFPSLDEIDGFVPWNEESNQDWLPATKEEERGN